MFKMYAQKRIQRNLIIHTLQVGMYNNTNILENNLTLSYKMNMEVP